MKTCPLCKETKPLEAFHKDSRTKIGRASRCAECKRKERETASWNTPAYRRAAKIQHYYGITIEEYDQRYAQQEGKCAICDQKFDNLCIDHCHTTLKVRGLLCTPCNRGLGDFRDNVSYLRAAADYLS